MPSSLLSPIPTPTLREQAFFRLRDAIVAGVLAPSAPIVIDDLAETFGMSSMPVREALRRLVSDGLVEQLPRRGHRVAPLTKRSATNVIEVVGTLMVRAYELGVPALGAEEIGAMRRHLQAAAANAEGGDLIGALAGIQAMHRVVYVATGNPDLERALGSLGPRFDRVLILWYTHSIVEVGSSYRLELIEALERGEHNEAVEIMRRAWARLREVISERPDDPSP